MNNADLIAALRYCAEHEGCDYYIAKDCPREETWVCGVDCEQILMHDAADALEAADKRIARLEEDLKTREAEREVMQDTIKICEEAADRYKAQMPKEGVWIMDENPHDGDCRCSACLIAIDAMHERNHELLNALTGGKWWKFYRFCPNCGARMRVNDEQIH